MTTRKKAPPKNFKTAYAILKKNAEALQQANEPDIDNLMTTVEQSIEAYKICQTRIEAVQQALDAAFNDDINEGIDEDIDKDINENIDDDIEQDNVDSNSDK